MESLEDKSIRIVLDEFKVVRDLTMQLFSPLNVEDAVIQSDDFGSPPNWHIAHVTWFYQKILEKYNSSFNDSELYNIKYLNSYYQRFKNILPKSERGKFPRPTVKETKNYRKLIDEKVCQFLLSMGQCYNKDEIIYDFQLANQHEMQHQELMIYDLQHYYNRFEDPCDNYSPVIHNKKPTSKDKPKGMVTIPEGLYDLGFSGVGFCYDNELPEHKVYLQSFSIDVAPVTNGQYLKFITEKGYNEPSFWLADGWDYIKNHNWNSPLYWVYDERRDRWLKKDFHGYHPINMDEPVVNVSYYEADAYCKWADKRLPTEAEWEKAASWNEDLQIKTIYPWGNNIDLYRANLMESFHWSPSEVGSYPNGTSYYGCHQMLGDVWEWTNSEYTLYPGFRSHFHEYTDKWAINQKVLKGGCFATPMKQIRNSYRNYFKPHERLLFSGFRCAIDK